MQKVFNEVNTLDKRCYEKFNLTEDILMEHAAIGMANFIEKEFVDKKDILIVCGMGNNGADGITLARLLYKKFNINLVIPFELKSNIAKIQLQRVLSLGILFKTTIDDKNYDIVVDCIFGSGLNRNLDSKTIDIIKKLNDLDGYKIACDISSGINSIGQINQIAFKANITITMGALKKALFSDLVKDYTGDIVVADLGVNKNIYEMQSKCYLLETKDLQLPYRKNNLTHKGTFGHLLVVSGTKSGASELCAKSAFETGVGLISIFGKIKNLSCEIMQIKTIPHNCSAIALGMGLGEKVKKKIIQNAIPKVIDADIFYNKKALKILLKQNNNIFTPHPKEFCSLLKIINIADISIEELQRNRFYYLELFCKKYPNIVLLLKGSNVLIGYNDKIYINHFGSSKLSFGGSGDVLTGMISSLLAQGYTSIDSAISGSLIHTFAAKKYKKNNFSLTPKKLIKQIKKI